MLTLPRKYKKKFKTELLSQIVIASIRGAIKYKKIFSKQAYVMQRAIPDK